MAHSDIDPAPQQPDARDRRRERAFTASALVALAGYRASKLGSAVIDASSGRVAHSGTVAPVLDYSFQPFSFAIVSSRARRSSSRLASAHRPSKV